MALRTVIVGTGSAIPRRRVSNAEMLGREFWGPDGKKIPKSNEQIIDQFEAITGIRERRYAEDSQVTSDLAAIAATDALDSSGIDRETLDTIIVAHNFGDVRAGSRHSDLVPALAARVKAHLKVVNPAAAAFDV
nr:ketoacyl-ACP synthase III [Vicinamibacteria bacterium]